MADAEARFVISLDTAGASANAGGFGTSLEKLKTQITGGTKALQEMVATAARLKGSADVQAFESVGKSLQRAQADVEKFEAKFGALHAKLTQTTDIKAARGLQAQMAEAQKSMAAAQGKVSALSAQRDKLASKDSVKAYRDVTAAITEKQGALAKAQTEFSRLGGTMTETAEKAQEGSGALGGFASKLEGLKSLGAAGAIAAIAVAVVAVGVAALAAAVAVTNFVLGLSDAARTAGIFRDATARSAEGGAALGESINRVYQRVGGSRQAIEELALGLRRVGLEGRALESSIESIQSSSRVFGQAAGSAIQGLIDRAVLVRRGVLLPLELRGTGIAFADVAAALAKNMKVGVGAASAALRNGQVRVEAFTLALRDATRVRTGDALRKLALSLPEQFAKARDNIARIFAVDPSKALAGLESVLSLLDENTASGKALRSLMKTIFQPLLDAAEKIFPYVRVFLLSMIIATLDFAIAAVDLALAIQKILPDSIFGDFDGLELAFKAGQVAAVLLGTGLFLVAAGLAVVIASVLIAAAPFVALGAAVYYVANALADLYIYVEKLFTGGGAKMAGAGSSIVDGLTGGVNEKKGGFFSAMADMAKGGLLAFNKEAKIASPSKAFRETAFHIPEGAALGVEDGAPLMSRAVADLASPAALDAGEAAGGSARGRGAAVHIEQITIDARGSSSEAMKDSKPLLEAIVGLLEDACRQAGLTPPTVGAVQVLG